MFKNIPHLFRHRVDVDPPPGATASRPRIRHATLQVAEYCGTLLSGKKKHLKLLRFWLGKNQPETSMTLLYALDLSERIRNLYITNMTNDEVNPIINYPNNWPNGGHQMVDYGFTRLCVSLSKLISPMWKAHLQTNLVLSPWNSLTHQTTRNESWPNSRWSVSNHI